MSVITKKQTCPYCGWEEDSYDSIWDEGGDEHFCTSTRCGKSYYVRPQYLFIGFEVDKYCEKCEVYEEEGMCYCDVEGEA